MNDNELKVTALKQRLGEVVSDYEERIADLRVAVTRQQEEINNLNAALEEAANKSESFEDSPVVEGEVVE